MKQMLARHLTDLCGMLVAMTAFPRPSIAAVDVPRRMSRIQKVYNTRRLCDQSFATKPICIIGLQLLAGFGIATSPAMAATSAIEEPADAAKLNNAMSWNLSGTRIVEKGRTDVLTEGEFVHDFIIESKATATDPKGSVVPAGTFKLVLSAFSPAYDQRGQKKGAWYVWGKWTLTDSSIPANSSAKQRAGELSGQIKAELPFNPLVTDKNWTASVRLPMTRIAPAAQAGSSQPARGEGAFAMDSKREGKLSLNLRLWPMMQH